MLLACSSGGRMLTFALARWRSVASSLGQDIRIHCSCLARASIYPTWSGASDSHEWKQVHLPDGPPVAREPTATGSDYTQQLNSQRRRGVFRSRAPEALKGAVHNGDIGVGDGFEFPSYRKLELLQRLREMGRRLEWRAALTAFRRARTKGLIADDIMYSCIITVMAKSGRWSEALHLLEQAHQDGIAPNKYCYTAAVNACAKGRKSRLAMALLQEMRVKGLRPDHVTYGSAITAMAKSGEWERALGLLREMAEEGLQPNVVCFGAAVDACAKGGQWRKAVSLLEEMREAGVEPDRICYNTAVNACAQSGQWEIAVSITDKMHCAGEEASRPDTFTLNSVMHAMACVGEWERLLRMLHGMHDVGVVPDVVSYNTAMRACNEAQQYRRTLSTFETMLQAGVSPDNESFTAAAEACASDETGRMGARALELLELAREQGFDRPCARVVAASLSACVGGGPWREAIPTVEDMLRASGRNAWDDVMKFLKGLHREGQDGGLEMYPNAPTLHNFEGLAPAATDELNTKGSGGVPAGGETLDEREIAQKQNHTTAYIKAPRIASACTQPDLTSASEQAHAEGVPRDEEGEREQRCGSTVKGAVAAAASFKLGCVPALAQAVTAATGAATDHSFIP